MNWCPLVHAWSKWNAVERGPVVVRQPDGQKAEVGTFIVQQRTCTACGKTQLYTAKARV